MGKKKAEPKDEIAPLEAYAPQALMLQGEDFLIRGCDGDQEYVWVAHWRGKTYTITEVYPGLLKKRTTLRDADEPDDLKLEGRFKDLPEALEELTEILMEGFDDDGDGGIPEPVPTRKLALAASN